MQCPVCHTEFEGSPRFCNKCGSNIEATRATNAPETELSADPFIGQTIGGRYKIVRLLGEGGMGAVYLGEQNIGGTLRKVAVKTLHLHLSNDPKIKQRFERECATVAELQHPNTIQLYDYGTTEEGILYMVMEFVQGESLASILEKKKTLDIPRTQHILQQICDALGEAHALGIVHRDLKPDNIVLTERAKDWVKVLDFGIAKRSEAPDKEEAKLTQQGTVLGTPPYMSPEQFTGKPIDARSDIYSIGVMAYEMLAGTLPFTANTPWEWATQHMTVMPQPLVLTPSGAPLPPAMTAAIMQSLAKDPAARFSTTKEFYDAFSSGAAAAAAGLTGTAGPSGGTAIVPAGLMAGGAGIDQKGKTQIGDSVVPASGPFGMPGAPPGVAATGTAPGLVGGGFPGGLPGGHYGTPAAGNVAFPVTAIPPAPLQEKSGGGKGGLIAFLGILGVLSAAAVVVALTHHAPSTPSTSVAGGSVPGAQPVPSVAIAPTVPTVDPNPLDTSVAPLNSSSVPPIPGKKGGTSPSAPSTPATDSGNVAPPGAPSLSPSSAPSSLIPSTPLTTTDPVPCKKARALRAKNFDDYKHRLELEKLKERCFAAGGSL
jgi:tRNA A-37 threonylcarbamoyl transferase component Bud32